MGEGGEVAEDWGWRPLVRIGRGKVWESWISSGEGEQSLRFVEEGGKWVCGCGSSGQGEEGSGIDGCCGGCVGAEEGLGKEEEERVDGWW